MPVRSTRAVSDAAPRSAGWTWLSPPPRRPTGRAHGVDDVGLRHGGSPVRHRGAGGWCIRCRGLGRPGRGARRRRPRHGPAPRPASGTGGGRTRPCSRWRRGTGARRRPTARAASEAMALAIDTSRLAVRRAGGERPRRPVDGGRREVELEGGVGQVVLHRLEGADRHPELLPLGHVGDGQVEHPPAEADELGGGAERAPVEGEPRRRRRVADDAGRRRAPVTRRRSRPGTVDRRLTGSDVASPRARVTAPGRSMRSSRSAPVHGTELAGAPSCTVAVVAEPSTRSASPERAGRRHARGLDERVRQRRRSRSPRRAAPSRARSGRARRAPRARRCRARPSRPARPTRRRPVGVGPAPSPGRAPRAPRRRATRPARPRAGTPWPAGRAPRRGRRAGRR